MSAIEQLKRKRAFLAKTLADYTNTPLVSYSHAEQVIANTLEELVQITDEIRKLQDAIPMEQDQQGCWHGSFNKDVNYNGSQEVIVHNTRKCIQVDVKPRFVGLALVYEAN